MGIPTQLVFLPVFSTNAEMRSATINQGVWFTQLEIYWLGRVSSKSWKPSKHVNDPDRN